MSGRAEGIEDAVNGDGDEPSAGERVQITIEQAMGIALSLMKE